jgi:hypothetical protein
VNTTLNRRRIATTLVLGTALAVPSAGTAFGYVNMGTPYREPHNVQQADPAWAASPRSQEPVQQHSAVAPGLAHALALQKYAEMKPYAFGGKLNPVHSTPASAPSDDGTDLWLPIGLGAFGVLLAGGTAAQLRRQRISKRLTRVAV